MGLRARTRKLPRTPYGGAQITRSVEGTDDGDAGLRELRRGGADLETLARVVGRVRANIEQVIEGKPDVVIVGARRCCSPRVTS